LSEGDNRDIKPRLAPGFLGIDLVPDGAGGYKIGHIVRGDGFRTGERSPLADPSLKVREGMHVLSIAGVPTRVGNDVFGGLVGRVGQVVGVRLNDKPGEDGARTVYVRPVANELRMRLLDWVESNRRYVERSSEGKVGYIYLDAMGDEDMSDFVKQYFAQRDRDALLIDVRFNNGGYVQDFINRVLASKLTGFFNMRESPVSWTRQQDYFSGPMACLMNEFSISCGEEFPHRFRDLGTGPLFGRRTQGGEVGSSPGWPLVDGGVISVPNYGMWTPKDGWVIEGPGVAPDYDVPSDPNAFAQGKDPQLDAAVRWLVAEARKRPPVRRTAPPDPVRVRRG
jgi:tricorn protease